MDTSTKLIRIGGVMEKLGVSKSQVWYLTKIGDINSIKLSPRITVWKLEDIEDYISSKVGV